MWRPTITTPTLKSTWSIPCTREPLSKRLEGSLFPIPTTCHTRWHQASSSIYGSILKSYNEHSRFTPDICHAFPDGRTKTLAFLRFTLCGSPEEYACLMCLTHQIYQHIGEREGEKEEGSATITSVSIYFLKKIQSGKFQAYTPLNASRDIIS